MLKIRCIEDVFIKYSQSIQAAKADIWFIHGFGESGLSFIESFSSKLSLNYNMYVLDLPGFGASPLQEQYVSFEEISELLLIIIKKISSQQPLIIISHSMGSIVGQYLCQKLDNQVELFVSVEGFLIEDKERYSSKFSQFPSAIDFKSAILKTVSRQVETNIPMARYFASLLFADAEVIMQWARNCYINTNFEKLRTDFLNLDCKKIYISGRSLAKGQTDFLKHNQIKHIELDSDHWVMIDQFKEFYETIKKHAEACFAHVELSE